MARPLTRHSLLIDGNDVAYADSSERRALRRAVQIVFQNPYGSLNPRQTVGDALMEPLLVNGEREGVYWYWTNRSRRWMVRSTRRS